MVINQSERMAKGYAFTSMEGAVIVLRDAQKTAKEGGYGEVWKDATIVTVPMDIAVRLALQKRDRYSERGQTTLASILNIIPTNENRDEAIQINKGAFQDQGKTPLFYIDSDDAVGTTTMPMYFNRQMLVQEWTAQNPGQALPPVKALELTYILEAALRGYANKLPNNGNVSFVADPEQVNIAKQLRSKGLDLTMYKMDQMIV